MTTTLHFPTKLHYHGNLTDLMSVFAMAPMHVIEFDTDEAGVECIKQKFRDHLCRTFRNANGPRVTTSYSLYRFAENEFVFVRGDGCNDVEIIAPSPERAEALLQEVRASIGNTPKVDKPRFSMISTDNGDLSAETVEDLPAASDDAFLRLCYGQNIVPWIDDFRERTVSRTGGFTLLDGPPGTGKTSLITQMMLRLSSTHVFYVLPVAQANAFASSDFIPFWQRENARHSERVKLVVVEDADRLLRRRDDDGGAILPAMLNVADGLAGRMLRLHVICSINCPLDQLDPAILRPGRLLNHRRFDLLDSETAQSVARHADSQWLPHSMNDRYSLAEVLNPDVLEKSQPKRILGFAA